MPLARFNVRLCPDQVATLEACAEVVIRTQLPDFLGMLLRTGAAWVLAMEGRTPAEVENIKNKSQR